METGLSCPGKQSSQVLHLAPVPCWSVQLHWLRKGAALPEVKLENETWHGLETTGVIIITTPWLWRSAMACLYIQEQSLSLLKRWHGWNQLSWEQTVWSQKSHLKATVFLLWVNKPEGILHCYTEELVMIVFSQSTITGLCCPGFFFFFTSCGDLLLV